MRSCAGLPAEVPEQCVLGGQPVLLRPSVSDALSGVGSRALVETGRQRPPGHRQMPGLLGLLSEKGDVGEAVRKHETLFKGNI